MAGSPPISQIGAEGTPLEGGWSVRGRHKREAVSAPHQDHPWKRSRPLTQSPHHPPPGELLKSHPPHLSSHTHVTTANEESGSYSSLTAEVTPQSVLTLLCPWTKEIPTRLRQRLHWNPTPLPEGEIHDPTALILYAGDDDPTSLHQAMLQESQHWPVQILEIDNKRPGKAIEHDMLREEPYTADFVEQPCRASSGPYWAAPTAAHGPSFDGSPSQAPLNQSEGGTRT